MIQVMEQIKMYYTLLIVVILLFYFTNFSYSIKNFKKIAKSFVILKMIKYNLPNFTDSCMLIKIKKKLNIQIISCNY